MHFMLLSYNEIYMYIYHSITSSNESVVYNIEIFYSHFNAFHVIQQHFPLIFQSLSLQHSCIYKDCSLFFYPSLSRSFKNRHPFSSVNAFEIYGRLKKHNYNLIRFESIFQLFASLWLCCFQSIG